MSEEDGQVSRQREIGGPAPVIGEQAFLPGDGPAGNERRALRFVLQAGGMNTVSVSPDPYTEVGLFQNESIAFHRG